MNHLIHHLAPHPAFNVVRALNEQGQLMALVPFKAIVLMLEDGVEIPVVGPEPKLFINRGSSNDWSGFSNENGSGQWGVYSYESEGEGGLVYDPDGWLQARGEGGNKCLPAYSWKAGK